jgi:hypothetical protein
VRHKYYVVWEIDIDAETPQDAARKALEIQRNQDSIATCFQVYNNDNDDAGIIAPGFTTVDLMEQDEEKS